jgi:SAM-dependent methyltransferase
MDHIEPKFAEDPVGYWESLWSEADYTTFNSIFVSDVLNGRSVLDVGCGSMEGGIIRNCSPSSVVGVDFSRTALKRAAEFTATICDQKVPLIRANALRLPFMDDSFDCVVAIELLTGLGVRIRDALAELTRVAKKVVVFSVTHIDSLPDEQKASATEAEFGTICKLPHADVIAFNEDQVKKLLRDVGLAPTTLLSSSRDDFDRVFNPYSEMQAAANKSRIHVEALKIRGENVPNRLKT